MTSSQTSMRLALPLLQPAQALKHITINEALRLLDWLVQLSVLARQMISPPADAEDGAAYILGANADGDWAGWPEGSLVFREQGLWTRIDPKAGWQVYVEGETQSLSYDGANWIETDRMQEMFGVNTQADPVNRLAVKSDSVLLSHDDVSPGSGDMRLIINRSDEDAAASLLFQTNYEPSAEIALDGAEGMKLSVVDGLGGLSDAIRVASSTGAVTVSGAFEAEGGMSCSSGSPGQYAYSDLPFGFSHGSVQPSNGYPGSGTVLTVRHVDNRTFQIFIHGVTGALSIRANHITHGSATNNWSEWSAIWGEGNDGSGSGLTADKVTAYTTAELPSAADRGAGALVYILDGDSGLAVSDGSQWLNLSTS